MKKYVSVFLVVCILMLTSCIGRSSVSVSENHDLQFSSQTEIKTVNHSDKSQKVDYTSTVKSEISTFSKATNPDKTAHSLNQEKSTNTTSKTSSKPRTTSNFVTDRSVKTTKHSDNANNYCYFSIECKTVLDNMSKLKNEIVPTIPSDGIIFKKTKVSFKVGQTVYDIFKIVCQNNVCSHACKYCKNRIQFESVFTPGYNTYYIRGIHYLYEKDCGTKSGWMYYVNGKYAPVSVDQFVLNNGDDVRFAYTCNLGEDL